MKTASEMASWIAKAIENNSPETAAIIIMEEYNCNPYASNPSPVEYPEAIIANFQPASPMSAEQVEVLHAIMVLAEHGIPGYAFGDNEAACEMDNRLSEICRLASTTPPNQDGERK